MSIAADRTSGAATLKSKLTCSWPGLSDSSSPPMLFLPLLPLLLLLLSGVVLYLMPTSWLPTSLLSHVSFALLSSQLLQSLPLVQSLTADSASARTVLSYVAMLLALCCTPSSILRLYADAVAAAGPLLGVCSAAVWVEAVTRGSRIISRAIGEAEREGENSNGLKVRNRRPVARVVRCHRGSPRSSE